VGIAKVWATKRQMLHVVEINFAGENFRELISRVREWLDDKNIQHRGYWLSRPLSVLRVNFEFEEQAQAFAQAFGGVVLVRIPMMSAGHSD
jgi:hypothetical protein